MRENVFTGTWSLGYCGCTTEEEDFWLPPSAVNYFKIPREGAWSGALLSPDRVLSSDAVLSGPYNRSCSGLRREVAKLHLEDSVPVHSVLPRAFICSVFLPSLPQRSVNLGEGDRDGPFMFLLVFTIDAHVWLSLFLQLSPPTAKRGFYAHG